MLIRNGPVDMYRYKSKKNGRKTKFIWWRRPALVAQTGTGGAYRHWWRITGTGGALPALVAQTGTGGAVCKGATPSVEQ